MENYFYLNEKNEQKGPVSPEELISNGVTKNTLVWKNGMAQWLPAGEVSELANLFTDTPAIPSHTSHSQTGKLVNMGNSINRIMLFASRSCFHHLRHESGQPLELRSTRRSNKSFEHGKIVFLPGIGRRRTCLDHRVY